MRGDYRHMRGDLRKWLVSTDLGTVTVWASSEAQARSRGRWKAVHVGNVFRNRAEEMIAVRSCEAHEAKRLF